MASRLSLHTELKTLLGSSNVYYQPPASVQMNYTAIVYSLDGIEDKYANDETYSRLRKYKVVVISKRPDDPVIDKLLNMKYCSWVTNYTMDNLYHDVFTLYY